MTAYQFSLVFLAALALSTALRIWLDLRHLRHVVAHRDRVPADFFGRIDLVDHRKAADYTAAKVRLGLIEIAVDTVVLLALTLGGGLALIDQGLQRLARRRLLARPRAVRRGRPDRLRHRPAGQPLPHLHHRSALRLQQADRGRCGLPTWPRAPRSPC
jgi:hypothetical protein